MLNLFFKSHHLIVHLPIAIVIFLLIIHFSKTISPEIKRKLLRHGSMWLMVVFFFLCSTGLGMAYAALELTPIFYLHGCIGVALYFLTSYFYFIGDPRRVFKTWALTFALVLLATITGISSAFDFEYFTPSTAKKFSNEPLNQKVSLVIEKKCIRCHNSVISAGHLNFSGETILIKDIANDPFIISRLQKAISPKSSIHMPYNEGNLSLEEIAVLDNWILSLVGNEKRDRTLYDNVSMAHQNIDIKNFKNLKKNNDNWTFKKFLKPEVPKALFPTNNEIDNFIFSKLSPTETIVEPLTKAALARRYSLVLTGLEPTTIELGMPADKLKNIYLQSKRYGENLGVYYMDLANFADDHGPDGTAKQESLNQKFRAYVIDGLNADAKYFSLLKDHIQPSAAGYKSLLNHIPVKTMMDISLDSAQNTLYSFSLGLEMRCARCHDHPTEPITNEQYYSVVTHFKPEFKINYDLLTRVKGGVLPKPEFLDFYEGTNKNKKFNKVSDLGDWMTDINGGVGYYSARFFVDNMWRFVFGKGLVSTAGKFGATTPEPEHLALLNWLTYDFIEHKTSIRHLIDKMVSSRVFQSQLRSQKTPGSMKNFFHGRLKTTENIRDTILQVAGILDPEHPDWSRSKDTLAGPAGPIRVQPDQLVNLRTVYFLRQRWDSPQKNMFETYLTFPKFMDVLFERPNSLEISSEFLFFEEEFFSRIFAGLNKAFDKKFDHFSDTFVDESYARILSRSATSEEKVRWKEFFDRSKNFEKDRVGMYRILLSSSEFLYIQ